MPKEVHTRIHCTILAHKHFSLGNVMSCFHLYHIFSASVTLALLLGSLPSITSFMCLTTVLETGVKFISLPITRKILWPKCLCFEIWKKVITQQYIKSEPFLLGKNGKKWLSYQIMYLNSNSSPRLSGETSPVCCIEL